MFRTRLLPITLALGVALLAFAPGLAPAALASGRLTFPDLVGHWAEPVVAQAVAAGYVNGYPDGTFRPEAPVTRAELLKLMAAAGRLPAQDPARYRVFKDTAGHWVEQQGYMAQGGIFGLVDPDDYPGYTFHPDQPATRLETAIMALRLLGRQGQIAALSTAPLDFADTTNLPTWARGWVKQATLDGLLTGYPDNTFRPDQPVTRAEAVVIVERTLAVMTKGVDPTLKLTVNGQTVTPTVPLAVRDGYVYAPVSALYGAIPYTRIYDWPTSQGVAPGNAAFQFQSARLEFPTGAAHLLVRSSDQQSADALDENPLPALTYRLYGQVMLPVAPATAYASTAPPAATPGGAGSLPYLVAAFDAGSSTLQVTEQAGWPGDSLPAGPEAASLCYNYSQEVLRPGQSSGVTPANLCDGSGNALRPAQPVTLTVSVQPGSPLRLRQGDNGPLVTQLTMQTPYDGAKVAVVVPLPDNPDQPVAEGQFGVTFTGPGTHSVASLFSVSDHRPYMLLLEPVAPAAAGKPVTVTLRLIDRYNRPVGITTAAGPSLAVTDPSGAALAATPKLSYGSYGDGGWILANGVATYTFTPATAGTYHLQAGLQLPAEQVFPWDDQPVDLQATGQLISF